MSIYHSTENDTAVENILGYTFNDKALLHKALEAAGSSTTPEGNKRLGLVGDPAITLISHLEGYDRNDYTEDMTNLENKRACNSNLARLGFSKGLDQYIHVNPSQGNHVSNSLMATTVEALIGAVLIDSILDIPKVRIVIIQLGIFEDS